TACLGELTRRIEAANATTLAHIGDAAFIGRFALNALLRDFASTLSDEQSAEAIRFAGKAHREASRSLRVVHRHCCEILGCAVHRPYFARELDAALETRQAYAALRRAARRVEVPELKDSLRHAMTTLAVVRARPCFPKLRAYDRVVLEELFQRIRGWLVSSSKGAHDELDGSRLLQEYFNFVEFALEVNKRPELVEHDIELINLGLNQLESHPVASVQPLLAPLLGRDEALDALLNSTCDTQLLRDELERVLGYIGGERHSEVALRLPLQDEPGDRN
ncbi:MAG: hypothetical protein KC492_45660, partial [Myxococcales bacterium]|nr:hypothetical protein [Myxococcales bacterium]